MKLRKMVITVALSILAAGAHAQSYRSTVNDGNDLYHNKQYDRAREKYEQAAIEEPERPESFFNAGNAAYRNNDIKAALDKYEKAGLRVKDKQTLARTLYNAGNTFLNAAEKGEENPALKQAAGEEAGNLQMEGYKQAIEMYKKALKLDPNDQDARYNLTYARKKLEDLQKQQQNQNKDQNKDKKDQKQDKQKDQKNQDKNKQEEQQKKDKQDQEKQKQQNQKDNEQKDKAKQDQQQQPQPQKEQNMSKQQAEQILRALQRDEKELQKKKRQQQGRRINVEKDW
ncbi:MAG: tetratricopeptide repeat protein [Bacteroidetes bacterium]|nr:tetratricopeptide repeat protein [Bacteroidota bacterium]